MVQRLEGASTLITIGNMNFKRQYITHSSSRFQINSMNFFRKDYLKIYILKFCINFDFYILVSNVLVKKLSH